MRKGNNASETVGLCSVLDNPEGLPFTKIRYWAFLELSAMPYFSSNPLSIPVFAAATITYEASTQR